MIRRCLVMLRTLRVGVGQAAQPLRSLRPIRWGIVAGGGGTLATTLTPLTTPATDTEANTQPEDRLQHEWLLRQACTCNTTAASQLLITLASAITDTSQKFREGLSQEMFLTDLITQFGGDNPPSDYVDAIIAQRAIVADLKHNLLVLSGYMEYVEKLATAVAELSYLTGNTVASDMICEQIHHVKKVFDSESGQNNTLENENRRLQVIAIETAKRKEETPEPNPEEIEVDDN